MEGRGGVFCSPKLPHFRAISQQFLSPMELLTEQFFISFFDSSSHSQCGALISKTIMQSFSKNSTHYSYFPGEDIAVMFLYRFNAATCKKINITVWVIVGWYQLILKKTWKQDKLSKRTLVFYSVGLYRHKRLGWFTYLTYFLIIRALT